MNKKLPEIAGMILLFMGAMVVFIVAEKPDSANSKVAAASSCTNCNQGKIDVIPEPTVNRQGLVTNPAPGGPNIDGTLPPPTVIPEPTVNRQELVTNPAPGGPNFDGTLPAPTVVPEPAVPVNRVDINSEPNPGTNAASTRDDGVSVVTEPGVSENDTDNNTSNTQTKSESRNLPTSGAETLYYAFAGTSSLASYFIYKKSKKK